MINRAFKILLIGLLLIVMTGGFFLFKGHDKKEIVIVDDDLYDFDLLNKDHYYTYEDDEYSSLCGIDISEHNKEIDFAKVKESGIDFVFIRIGWRGYTVGDLYIDSMYHRYIKDAKDNGLLVGVYFFSQALNEEEAQKEAELVLSVLDDEKLDLPVVYDFEDINHDTARSDGISKEQCTANVLAFFEIIEKKYDVMLYANSVLLNEYYDMERLKNYKLWYAQYNALPECDHAFSIWQYTDKGKVEGIEKDVDLNIMFIKK